MKQSKLKNIMNITKPLINGWLAHTKNAVLRWHKNTIGNPKCVFGKDFVFH